MEKVSERMSNTEAIQLSRFQEFDPKRYVSKLLHDSEKSRVVLFCLEKGQELSPHESASEVIFYGVEGKATILVGAERVVLGPKSIVVCPPMVPHGISASERVTVLAVLTPRPG